MLPWKKMGPLDPKDFMIYYALGSIAALLVVFALPRRRRGLRLRMGGPTQPRANAPVVVAPGPVERPLNVIFQYNGESWDAFEVLGLPAGSSPEMVEAAYREEIAKSDATMRPFLDAAHQAVITQFGNARRAVR